MDWFYLFLSGIFEIVWAIAIKYTGGFTKFFPSIGTIVAAITSFYFLSLAIRTIPLSTSYVVFTAMGTLGTVLFGIFVFGESRDWLRILCIFMVIFGTVGLEFFTKK